LALSSADYSAHRTDDVRVVVVVNVVAVVVAVVAGVVVAVIDVAVQVPSAFSITKY